MRFVVVSSDVVYPTGAMRDYEAKFWLPFKGVTRPVYAIPGNHDWYDALEGFDATFLTAGCRSRRIRARVESDLRLTSTTDEPYRGPASRKPPACARPTASRPASSARLLRIQTDRFALVAIDTGVVRTIDPDRKRWLESGAGARGRQDSPWRSSDIRSSRAATIPASGDEDSRG